MNLTFKGESNQIKKVKQRKNGYENEGDHVGEMIPWVTGSWCWYNTCRICDVFLGDYVIYAMYYRFASGKDSIYLGFRTGSLGGIVHRKFDKWGYFDHLISCRLVWPSVYMDYSLHLCECTDAYALVPIDWI